MGSKKDQPDAGLKSLNHCMRVVSFFNFIFGPPMAYRDVR